MQWHGNRVTMAFDIDPLHHSVASFGSHKFKTRTRKDSTNLTPRKDAKFRHTQPPCFGS